MGRTLLISAYAPNIFEAGFYDLLTKTLLDLAGFHLVVGADFNAVWDKNIDRTGEVENRDKRLASDAQHRLAAHAGTVDVWRNMNLSLKDYSFIRAGIDHSQG